MSALVPTLRSLVDHADALYDAGRVAAARTAYEDLLERAQEKGDRGSEVIARCMLARCHLRRKDLDAARDAMHHARRGMAYAERPDVARRYQAANARLIVAEAEAPPVDRDDPYGEPSYDPDPAGAAIRATEGLRDYLDWARENGAWEEAIDACCLLASTSRTNEDKASWLHMAADVAAEHELDALGGKVFHDLAVVLELLDRHDDALEAWENAARRHAQTGTVRQQVSAAWAAGSIAIRLEDFALAQTRLEKAVHDAEPADDCDDLLALALADLAIVHELTGDVVEARRVLIRALQLARENDLVSAWPDRWRTLADQARRLEVE